MEATHWRGQSYYESQVLRQVARGPPPHPWHSDPLATKKLLSLTVRNLEWEPLRPSCKKLSLDVVGKKPEDHASQFAPGRCLLHQRWPRKHPPSIRIQPHPATSHHLAFRNCMGINWIWNLPKLIWQLKMTLLRIRRYSTHSHSHAAFFRKPSNHTCTPRRVLPSTNGYTQIRRSQRRSIVDASAVGR